MPLAGEPAKKSTLAPVFGKGGKFDPHRIASDLDPGCGLAAAGRGARCRPPEATCENTIWSILNAMEASKAIDPSFRTPYCKPEGHELSVERAARIFVKYVNIRPELLRYPAEHAVLQALRSAYPCAG
jgi:hypothetical protein